MATIKDFAMSLLITALLFGTAAGILLLRDRRTLRPDMSPAERHNAIQRNTDTTLHWWHLILLIWISVLLVLGLGKGRSGASTLVVEAAIAAFLVFRYYRERSEDTIQPVPRNHRLMRRN